MEHFGVSDGRGGPGHFAGQQEPKTPEEKVLVLLRRCGHYLHHNFGRGESMDPAQMLAALSEEDKTALIALLEKCLQNWQAER